ncbi:hypothetical protein PFICI_04044 [Pestalotiopsis fici W106-1]|uniref:Short-chain dehydrogenase/reductase iacG n=1 Tax=Pestalotiopsis fici (strain W106-1 / CGMCC3.15140) TaxID=1229662 RepID=IACG_PESFW|nr:uncharacterized protein PFICI_04044 [Pestalotiopsis fici W106-1]A0A1J0HSP5.1 RecName: Full=Short-chain dehydrogenase/reductase iacG; AltName: Full=Iso-A82775C biosynthesis cluster protein G [Pestalotiopsis fici W106-1]APC57599.1 oxidase/reductase [Pestalotiopsis fici]ETS86019.1 hypothetical protein PFICI_04044 [Pestalotiopsis fici W106-1]
MTETVLVIGATGHIGVSAVIGALRTKRNVLAVVRNAAAVDKLFRLAGTRDGITTVEADITSEHGLQSVVDKVKNGELPAFQHVYSAVGGVKTTTPLKDLSIEDFRANMSINFDTNFFAYRATIGYLLSQSNPTTYTVITGAIGDVGIWPGPAMSQGALYSLGISAELENRDTNVRFNEMYLAFPVMVDEEAVKEEAAKMGVVKASDFARSYENLLAKDEIKGSRIFIFTPGDIDTLRWESKAFKGPPS